MKWGVCLLLLVIPILCYGGCVTTKDTIMYFNPARFCQVDRVLAVNQTQGLVMMKEDIINGDAVFVKERTRIQDVEKFNAYIGVMLINDQLLIGFLNDISCR